MSQIDHRLTGRCPRCGRRIVWGSVEGKQLVQMPIDRLPSEDGNIRVRVEHGRAWCRRLSVEEIKVADAAGEQLHETHYDTCPEPEAWRRW